MPYVPRGIENANPGNIRKAPQKWLGEVDGKDPSFCTFSDPVYGLRAVMVLFKRYYYLRGLKNVAGMINRWAPSSENNTAAYVTAVAKQMNVSPLAPLTVDQPTCIAFAQAIALHENGRSFNPYPTYWYDLATYQQAYAMTVSNDPPAAA